MKKSKSGWLCNKIAVAEKDHSFNEQSDQLENSETIVVDNSNT
jgi:hypothetical protein